MSQYVDEYIKKYKPSLLKTEKYLKNNDWTLLGDIIIPDKGKPFNPKQDEFLVQDQSVLILIDRLKFFAKKASDQHRLPQFKKYVKHVMKVVDTHMDRIDNYINGFSLEKIASNDLKLEEMDFHNMLQKKYNTIDDAVEALGIKFGDEKSNVIEFLSDVKAPLSMHKVLMSIPEYAEIIQKELDYRKIDFDSPPNNEMLIYMENVPKWDTNQHYFFQEASVLQFYVDEFKKIKNGINIDGVYISGWAYYHINIYIAPIPTNIWNPTKKKFFSQDVKMNPPLRDSDFMIFENKDRLDDSEYKILFLACSRRVAKTTTEASMLSHAATLGEETLLCAGASAKDLEQLAKNFKVDNLNKNSAFRVYNVTNDWSKKVELGIKTKGNKTILLSTLHIINTDSGNNKEIFAGFSPSSVVVVDEALKSDFLEALEGLIPALVGAQGELRARVIISGTAGTEALSADGIKALNDPETYSVMPMQWDILERGVAPEDITWHEDKLKPFGSFIPGQCRVDMPKIESTLADYLGKPESEALRKIKIKVTDWKAAKEKIELERASVTRDQVKLHKTIIYAPMKPSEITMSGKMNRFPVAEAKAHKQHLLETGLWDRRRELVRDPITQKITAVMSDKQLAPFPHKGGIIDAPFLIFEDLPKEKPVFGTYVGSFDDYNLEDSDTSSVSTFYVMKNEVIGDPFSNKIVASISFRPEKHPIVWEKWLMLMEVYNLDQTAFGENVNYGIKDFLDRRKLSEKYLAPSLDFSKSFNIPNNQRRSTGWSPTTSKKTLFNLFVDYCNDTFEVPQEDGTTKLLKGVQMIDDIGLLEEIIQYSDNLNVDRVTSAQACVSYCHYLRVSNLWKPLKYRIQNEELEIPKQEQPRRLNFFKPQQQRNKYFNKR